MSYRDHLLDLVNLLLAVRPDLSDRRISMKAGLNPGWLNEYRAKMGGSLSRAERIVEVCRRECPADLDGAALRDRLKRYDELTLPGPCEDAA